MEDQIISIEDIYYMTVKEDKDDNIFETEETQKTDFEFTSKYINRVLATDIKAGIEMEMLYSNSLDAKEKSGFIAGFKTAVKLLTGGKTLCIKN